MNDKQDAVRAEAIKSVKPLIRMLIARNDISQAEQIFASLLELTQIKGGWRIKFQIAEMFPQFCDLMDNS